MWNGTNEANYHPEGLATFEVGITVTSWDGERMQPWSSNYQIDFTHSSDMDVANQPGASTTGKNMPKTGDCEVSAATWLLLAACAFAGWLLARKLCRD